jgi:hypothetical protein
LFPRRRNVSEYWLETEWTEWTDFTELTELESDREGMAPAAKGGAGGSRIESVEAVETERTVEAYSQASDSSIEVSAPVSWVRGASYCAGSGVCSTRLTGDGRGGRVLDRDANASIWGVAGSATWASDAGVACVDAGVSFCVCCVSRDAVDTGTCDAGVGVMFMGADVGVDTGMAGATGALEPSAASAAAFAAFEAAKLAARRSATLMPLRCGKLGAGRERRLGIRVARPSVDGPGTNELTQLVLAGAEVLAAGGAGVGGSGMGCRVAGAGTGVAVTAVLSAGGGVTVRGVDASMWTTS